MRMGDWLSHGGKQLRVRKLPLHRFFAWSWQCVRNRIGGRNVAAVDIGGLGSPVDDPDQGMIRKRTMQEVV
ncbi:hypothetical protein GGF39_003062 [Coemansia sp. RSA 1721]|nr:hypothetical protein GGF39_003062 [Coemansia sp. RSA 1721]